MAGSNAINRLDRRALLGAGLGAGLAAGIAARAAAQTAPPVTAKTLPPGLPQPDETIDLWPKGAPGAPITSTTGKPGLGNRSRRSCSAEAIREFSSCSSRSNSGLR